MRIPRFGILFLMLPILEIATIILVGNALGLWATLGLLLGTSVLGIFLLRWNALSMASNLQQTMNSIDPSNPHGAQRRPETDMIGGSMRTLGAFLMIFPGFICKTIGLLFLLPPLQKLLWAKLGSKMSFSRSGTTTGFHYSSSFSQSPQRHPSSGPTIVDLDEDDFTREPNQNSPWYNGKNGNDQKRID